MKKLNNQGFTLIEVIAAVAIIALLGVVATPSILNSINNSKEKSYRILVSNIATAAVSLYEELDYADSALYSYNANGTANTASPITISSNSVTVNLCSLAGNGFLKGNNVKTEGTFITIVNPKTDKDLGSCSIKVTKNTDSTTGRVTYTVSQNDSNSNCPTTNDYLKGVD